MKTLIVIFLSLLLEVGAFERQFSDKSYPVEYSEAVMFIKKNDAVFHLYSKKYDHPSRFVASIVFPEVMRYGIISDLLQVEALKHLYTRYGSDAADFSIGKFQMKPSFAESVEREVMQAPALRKKYASLQYPSGKGKFQERNLRLQRLQNLQWQLVYLHAFVDVCGMRFADVKFTGEEERMKFYATAFNAGYYNTPEKIIIKGSIRSFPFGLKYGVNQHAYNEIASYFYQHNPAGLPME